MCQDKLEWVSAVKICVSERVSVGAHVSEIKGVYEYSSGCGGKSPSGVGGYQRSEGPVTPGYRKYNVWLRGRVTARKQLKLVPLR